MYIPKYEEDGKGEWTTAGKGTKKQQSGAREGKQIRCRRERVGDNFQKYNIFLLKF